MCIIITCQLWFTLLGVKAKRCTPSVWLISAYCQPNGISKLLGGTCIAVCTGCINSALGIFLNWPGYVCTVIIRIPSDQEETALETTYNNSIQLCSPSHACVISNHAIPATDHFMVHHADVNYKSIKWLMIRCIHVSARKPICTQRLRLLSSPTRLVPLLRATLSCLIIPDRNIIMCILCAEACTQGSVSSLRFNAESTIHAWSD